jgi:hypothetical protein
LNQNTQCHHVGAHRQPELLAREGVGYQRRGVGEQERAADALDHAPDDQRGRAGGEPGAERGQAEEDEAADVGALASEEVRQAPGGQDEHGRCDQVGQDHPDQRQDAGVQRALEVGQRDDQRPGVDRRQQHPDAGARERPPLVVLVAGMDSDAARGGDADAHAGS